MYLKESKLETVKESVSWSTPMDQFSKFNIHIGKYTVTIHHPGKHLRGIFKYQLSIIRILHSIDNSPGSLFKSRKGCHVNVFVIIISDDHQTAFIRKQTKPFFNHWLIGANQRK